MSEILLINWNKLFNLQYKEMGVLFSITFSYCVISRAGACLSGLNFCCRFLEPSVVKRYSAAATKHGSFTWLRGGGGGGGSVRSEPPNPGVQPLYSAHFFHPNPRPIFSLFFFGYARPKLYFLPPSTAHLIPAPAHFSSKDPPTPVPPHPTPPHPNPRAPVLPDLPHRDAVLSPA